jgi:hypothetical protein
MEGSGKAAERASLSGTRLPRKLVRAASLGCSGAEALIQAPTARFAARQHLYE